MAERVQAQERQSVEGSPTHQHVKCRTAFVVAEALNQLRLTCHGFRNNRFSFSHVAAEERLIGTQAEIAANQFMWNLKLKDRHDAEVKCLEPQDRRVFEATAKKYGWAIHTANFELPRKAVGCGFP